MISEHNTTPPPPQHPRFFHKTECRLFYLLISVRSFSTTSVFPQSALVIEKKPTYYNFSIPAQRLQVRSVSALINKTALMKDGNCRQHVRFVTKQTRLGFTSLPPTHNKAVKLVRRFHVCRLHVIEICIHVYDCKHAIIIMNNSRK